MDKVKTSKFTKILPLLHKHLVYEWLARTDGDAARIIRRFCYILIQVSSGRGQVVMKGKVCLLITYPLPEIIIIIYLFLTAIGLTPSGSSTVHIYTHTENGTNITIRRRTFGKCGPSPSLRVIHWHLP
jgi:hypothetical protein